MTAGTIFHKTRAPLTGWFWALYRMSQSKKGISALQLSKEIGVSYPTAWLMQHKIRKAMADRDQGYQLAGLVEVDEGTVGGAERGKKRCGRGGQTKSVGAVAVERRTPGQEGNKPIPGFGSCRTPRPPACTVFFKLTLSRAAPCSPMTGAVTRASRRKVSSIRSCGGVPIRPPLPTYFPESLSLCLT